jgi:DNA helicase-2/ATP-dependent DNA helicase PcrA
MSNNYGDLNAEQIKPVEDTEGAVLVFAGAGSGKTRVLTHRIAHLVNDMGVSPQSILAITFTNKAADEMKERLRAVIPQGSMWVCTIHSMCTKILRSFGDKIGYSSNFSIYTQIDKERLLKRVFEELKIDDDIVKKSAAWHISNAKNSYLTPKAYEQYNAQSHKIKSTIQIFERYEQELQKCNSMDFDDLLTNTLLLLENFPEVRKHYQEKFQYIHIDEFQDTNRVQYLIFKILSDTHKNIFAVGDDDQSIYGWRGADVNNILNFARDFKDAKIYNLLQNYRSTKKILDAANVIIEKNLKRHEKKLYTENADGTGVENYVAFDEIQEAYYVVNQINNIKRQFALKYADFAILMRINALTRGFEQEMRKYNIPYKVFGGFKFFERKEIKDLIAYLRIVNNPRDEEAILRIINIPKRGIGDTAIGQLVEAAKKSGKGLFDTIMDIEHAEISNALINKISVFKAVLSDILKLNETMPLENFVTALIETIDYKQAFAGENEEDVNRALNVDEFILSVKEFASANTGATLSDYLESVSLSSDTDETEAGDDFVSVATVHSAKGLEFRCVFIVGLDEKIFPISRDGKDDVLEEERRLMYVAVTRAKERLFMTRAKSRFLFGERTYTLPSRFYNDLFPPNEKDFNLNNFTKTSARGFLNSHYGDLNKKDKSLIDYASFKTNSVIMHRVFGEGTIIDTKGEGESKMADVAFKGIGIKTLALQFAPIDLKDES